MKKVKQLFLLLTMGIGVVLLPSCGDEPTDDEPTPSEPICRLTNFADISGGTVENNKFTYNSSNQLIKFEDPDEDMVITYNKNKISTMTFSGTQVGTVDYGAGNVPWTIDFVEDGDTVNYILLSSGSNITEIWTSFVDKRIAYLEYKTTIAYDANGNVTEVLEKEHNPNTGEFDVFAKYDRISHDNKKNPYTTDVGLMMYTMFTGYEHDLGVNNVTAYTVTYSGSDGRDISNTYTYNEEGYPVTLDQIGYSSPYEYNFSYNCQ